MRTLYPAISPFAAEMMPVGQGQTLSVEQYGNPAGKPVVFLHGGPGAGTTPDQARFFDPERYRIVLFDQRGCGRSTPNAAEPGYDLSANTTPQLVADIEVIRQRLGIDRWQVFGGSWGSALALAYAETHPERVTELIVRGIFTLRRWEIDWFYNGPAGVMAPQAWDDLCRPLAEADLSPEDFDLVAAYHELLWSDDPAVAERAAVAWVTWETLAVTLAPEWDKVAATAADPRSALAFARIENHYCFNGGFFEDGQLLAQADRLRDIPGVIVQGAWDLCCPARTACDLAEVWPTADFQLVTAGHSAFEPAIAAALVEATDRFAGGGGPKG